MSLMRILFATDGSSGAETAARFLLSLPLAIGDRVSVLTVPLHRFGGGDGVLAMPPEEDLLGAAATIAERGRSPFAARGIQTCVLVREGPVAEAIERAALERAEELVVVGSRGLGTISGILLGSTGRALARRAPVSLLVVRDRSDRPRRLLAAVDASEESDAAMDLLARLPLPADVEVTLLHVLAARPPVELRDPPLADELRARSEQIESDEADAALARAAKALRGRYVARTLVERGDPAERIVLRATAGAADLVVLGSRGQRQPHGLLRTSVADEVLDRAHCAVLLAKAPLAPQAIHAEARAASNAVASLA
jgi:nucleotide-binding universal stress UspA family protein